MEREARRAVRGKAVIPPPPDALTRDQAFRASTSNCETFGAGSARNRRTTQEPKPRLTAHQLPGALVL